MDKPVSRRTVVKAGAWSIPVIAATAAVPNVSASVIRTFSISSSFGVGWYPTVQNDTSSGAFQFDAVSADPTKHFDVVGTQPGDTISNVYVEFWVSPPFGVLSFFALPGSNPLWTTPTNTGTKQVNGQTVQVYQFQFVGTVTATAGSTTLPIDFYFRASTPYPGSTPASAGPATAQTTRHATVNGTDVVYVGPLTTVSNTNVALANAPHP